MINKGGVRGDGKGDDNVKTKVVQKAPTRKNRGK